jgi:4-hydroxy-tetrahydrodipicolinate synthase
MSLGVEGVISVVANAFPSQFSKMVNLCLEGNFAEAAKIHFGLLEIINALFEDGSPAGIKAAVQILDLNQNNLRLPLVKANKSVYLQLTNLITNYLNK